MATWVNEATTSSGGNVSLVVSGGYGSVSRNGSSISFNWGVRFKQSSSSWTYNSICARPGGTNYYAIYSEGGSHTAKDTWYYATSTSKTVKKYTTEATPFSYSGTASGVGGGSVTISVGTAWNAWAPSSDKYTYSFTVSYPAAASYSVTYNANGGSGAPGGQTKYQGYSLTLQSGTPTRSGYAFAGWSGSDGGSYSAGSTFNGDYALTLTAKWNPTAPTFTAPSLSADETSLSWGAFALNTNSNVYYQLDSTSGSWTTLSTNTTTAAAKTVSGLSPGSSHTVYFKAVNASDSASVTTKSSTTTLYSYPYITGVSSATIDVGAKQTVSLYNPLKRSVSVSVSKVASTSQTFVSGTTTGTSVDLTIPINTVAPLISNNTTHTATIEYTSSYSGKTSTKSGTVNLSSSVGAPTIDTSKTTGFVTLSDVGTFTLNSTSYSMNNATGSTTKYLQGYSKLGYILNSSSNPFTAQYGASLSSYKVQINSKTATAATVGTQYYEGSSGGITTKSSAVAMTANNTYTLTISATDTRGFTSSFTRTFTTYPYSQPSLGTPQIVRDDGYGSKATVTISGSWCPNMNGIHLAKKITLYYKTSTASSYSSLVLYNDTTGSATSYKSLSGSYALSSLTFDSNTAYNIYVVAQDCFDKTATSVVANLALGTPLMFIDAAQKGVGVDCFPEGQGLYVDGVVKGKLVDSRAGYVTSGTSGLSSYWFKVWDYTSTTNQYNDHSFTLQLNDKYDNRWGQLGFGFRQNGANNGGAYNFGITLQRISGNWALDRLRLYYNNTTGYLALYANVGGQWGTFNYQVIASTWRTAAPDNGLGVFYSGSYSAAQTLPSSSYVTPSDLAALTSAYPVGAIYITVSDAEADRPGNRFGGTWERIAADKYLKTITSGTGGATGGSLTTDGSSAANTGGTKLEVKHLASHSHTVNDHGHHMEFWSWGAGNHEHRLKGYGSTLGSGSSGWRFGSGGGSWATGIVEGPGDHQHLIAGDTWGGTPGTNAQGGNEAHSHSMAHTHTFNPSYVAVYVWKRTA